MFGLQGGEGAHDGPHGSEDLCATWDPRPCLFPPLKRNRCGLPTLNWRRGKARKQKKSPGQLACSLVFRKRGAGAPGAPGCCLLQPGTCTDSQGQRLREPSQAPPGVGTKPGHWLLRGPSPEPQSLPDVGHGAGVPARPRLPSPRRVRCGSCAPPARPCCHPAAPPHARAGSQGAEYQS